MNETLSLDMAEAVETNVATENLENASPENSDPKASEQIKPLAFPRLDGEVMPLVQAHQDVIVRCHWMGGAEVSLTQAMINYPATMSEEIADQIIADINELLANRVLETKAEEKDAESEQQAEAATIEAEAETKDAGQTKTEKNQPRESKPAAKAESENAQSRAGVAVNQESSSVQKPDTVAEARSTPALKILIKAESSPVVKPEVVEPEPTVEIVEEDEVREEEQPEIEEVQPHETPPAGVEPVEPEETPENIELEPIDIAEAIEEEIIAEEIIIEQESIDTEFSAFEIPRTTMEPIEEFEEVERPEPITDFEPAFEPIDIEFDAEDLLDLAEEQEIRIDHFEVDLEIESYASERLPEEGEGQPQVLRAADHEEVNDMVVDQPEVQTTTAEDSETIGEADEPIRKTEEALEKIVEAVERSDEDAEKPNQELEELLVEVLEDMELACTPEEIKNLADKITRAHLLETIKKPKGSEESDDGPYDIGTHEAIKQILLGLAASRAQAHTTIGRSAIRLYNSLELALAA